jgi:hypothetical protein
MMYTRRLAALERYLSPPAVKHCRCLLTIMAGEPLPPDNVLCDRCGLMRQGEHVLVEYVVVKTWEEAYPADSSGTT